MFKSIYFKIAGHIIEVTYPMNLPLMDELPSFKDFVYKEENFHSSQKAIEISISNEIAPYPKEETIVHARKSETWGDGFKFEESKDLYITSMSDNESKYKVSMLSNKDFSINTIYLGRSRKEQYTLLSWFIMVAFGQGILPHKTVIIHASSVANNQQEAYAFLGKSGTGKSTHSQLWLKHLEGFYLLNDDNPIIRIENNKDVYIYGSPWSGKTHCYKNLKVKLKGMVRLQQAKQNKFQLKKNADSLFLLLPSCTAIRWNKKIFNLMVDTIQEVLKFVPIGLMDCLINKNAAEISYHGINNKQVE